MSTYTEMEIAIHEAGHFYAGYIRGLELPNSISITPQIDTWGRINLEPIEVEVWVEHRMDLKGNKKKVYRMNASTRNKYISQIIMLYSGPIAHHKYNPDVPKECGLDDFKEIERVFEILMFPENKKIDIASQYQGISKKIVNENWERINYLAKELVKKHEMDIEEILECDAKYLARIAN